MRHAFETEVKGFRVHTAVVSDSSVKNEWEMFVEKGQEEFVQRLWKYNKDPRGVSAHEFHETVVRFIKGKFFGPSIKAVEQRVKEYWKVRPRSLD